MRLAVANVRLISQSQRTDGAWPEESCPSLVGQRFRDFAHVNSPGTVLRRHPLKTTPGVPLKAASGARRCRTAYRFGRVGFHLVLPLEPVSE